MQDRSTTSEASDLDRASTGELDQPVRLRDVATVGSLAGVGREAVATMLTAAVWPLGLVDRGLAAASDRVRGVESAVETPVLLVHGYGATKSNWMFIERFLRNAGFGHVHAVTYNPLTADIPELGARIRDRARALMARAGTDRIHLVGHSMGGLVSRWAVQVCGLHEADTVITIASPHGGSPWARLGPGRSAAQMRPGSDVLRRLHRATVPPSTRFVAYWSEMDGLVPPARAQLLDPRLEATNVHVPGEGHLSIMVSRLVADSVTTQLAAAEHLEGAPRPVDSIEPRRRDRRRADAATPDQTAAADGGVSALSTATGS